MGDLKRASVLFEEMNTAWRQEVMQATVDAVKQDICEWMAKLDLIVEVSLDTFLDDLANGVALCALLRLIDSDVSANYFQKAKGSSFHARDNISQFLKWMDANKLYRFESEDVALGINGGPNFKLRQKIVAFSLLDLARYAGRRGFSPLPMLIQFEQEIEAEEKKPLEAVLVDDTAEPQAEPSPIPEPQADPEPEPQPQPQPQPAPEPVLPALHLPSEPPHSEPTDQHEPPQSPTSTPTSTPTPTPVKSGPPVPEPVPDKKILVVNIQPGMYMIGNKKVHIRVVGVHIMVRTGGGWQALQEWLGITYGKDSDLDIAEIFKPAQPKSASGKPGEKVTIKDIMSVDAVFTSEKNASQPTKVTAKSGSARRL